MKVSERDKVASKTLIEVLNKVSYKLEGSEVLIVARVMEWCGELSKRIEEDLNPPLPKTEVSISSIFEEKSNKQLRKSKKNVENV